MHRTLPYATFPHTSKAFGFSAGLIPLHSPLLRESSLVSFPPLSDMLKFSGSSRPTSGPKVTFFLVVEPRSIPSLFKPQLCFDQEPTFFEIRGWSNPD